MKYKVKYAGFFLFAIAFMVAACKPNPVEKLSKKWMPVDVKGDAISNEMKQRFVREGNIMEFTNAGKLISFTPGQKNDTGSYKLSEDARRLTIYSGNNKETIFNVTELRPNRLIIENHVFTLVLEPAK